MCVIYEANSRVQVQTHEHHNSNKCFQIKQHSGWPCVAHMTASHHHNPFAHKTQTDPVGPHSTTPTCQVLFVPGGLLVILDPPLIHPGFHDSPTIKDKRLRVPVPEFSSPSVHGLPVFLKSHPTNPPVPPTQSITSRGQGPLFPSVCVSSSQFVKILSGQPDPPQRSRPPGSACLQITRFENMFRDHLNLGLILCRALKKLFCISTQQVLIRFSVLLESGTKVWPRIEGQQK